MRSGLSLCVVVLLSGCAMNAVRIDAVQPSPSPTPEPTASPSHEPTPSSTSTSTPTPTPTPTPIPEPTPDPGTLRLEAVSCNGGVVLRWSPSAHPDFHHYIGLRSPERDIAPDYPPIAPAVDWGDLYATDRFVTSGFDATVVPSSTTWHYRLVAYDEMGRVVSQSEVASAQILPARGLGRIQAEVLDDGRVQLSWRRFDGVPECFSAYRVLHGINGVAGTLLTSVTDLTQAEFVTDALHGGGIYTIRVQAVHTATLGQFVLGESEVLIFTIAEAAP